MTGPERVKAIAKFGFTERQARFLVMVMRHAGICVPRQYAAFIGTAYGRRVNAMFDSLVARGYATVCGCLHNRARLYHVRHHALYRAIGEPHSRYRRPVPAGCVSERLMLLDGMLASPNTTWLATAPEKAHSLMALCPSVAADALPLECVVFPHSYRHLNPLVGRRSTSQEVEKPPPMGGPDPTVSSPQRSENVNRSRLA